MGRGKKDDHSCRATESGCYSSLSRHGCWSIRRHESEGDSAGNGGLCRHDLYFDCGLGYLAILNSSHSRTRKEIYRITAT